MGRTKALVEVDGVPMARRVADALLAGGAVDVQLVGGDADELASLGLPVILDRFPGEGPLGGVLTALSDVALFRHDGIRPAAGTDPGWLLIVPCDVPWLDAATVRRMCDATTSADDIDVIVATTDRLEYGCALWRTSTTDRIQELFDGGVRSLHGAMERFRTATVAVAPDALRNVNQPSDLSDPPDG